MKNIAYGQPNKIAHEIPNDRATGYRLKKKNKHYP
jgi:hypothetical protein